jgi:saccharopine dehydrogenase-like NADP-dependent oxidoreductase
MKVLLLGGVGEMCTPATNDIVKRGMFSKVTLADINLDKVKARAQELGLSEEDARAIDAGDPGQIVELMQGHDVVVNGLPKQFALNVLEAALEAKVSCCDLSSPTESILALDEKAKELNVCYVAGMGATPGVTNLLAKHGVDQLDEADEIHVSFAAMRPFALSPALTDTILREFDPENELRTYYKDGVFYPVPPFVGEKLIEFPHPIGPMKVYLVPHGETRSFPPNLNVKRVYVRGTFTPKDMRLMRSVLEYNFFDTKPIKINGTEISPKQLMIQALLQMPEATIKEDLFAYGLNVEVIGKKGNHRVKRTYWITHPPMSEWGIPYAYSNNVGIPLGICGQLIAEGKVGYGVNCPESLVDPDLFFAELAKRKIMVHYREENIK